MSLPKILHPHPALKLSYEGSEYLVVSDLHIGFEERFSREGVKISPSAERMLQRLLTLVRREKPDKLLILGDVKGSVERVSRAEWAQIPPFMEKVSREVEISIIPGNHDGGLTALLPREIRIEPSSLMIGDIGLLHGHTGVSRDLSSARRLIIGHIHPTYNKSGSPLSGHPVWVILRLHKNGVFEDYEGRGRVEVWIMPAFNLELSAAGLTVFRERLISPLLRRVSGLVEDAAVMTLEGVVVGGAESLSSVL